jgi:hypothetical protein
MTTFLWAWAIVGTGWAVLVTIMLLRNPLPFPDRGHRAYALPHEDARQIVLQVLNEIGGLKEHFSFAAGPTYQTIMWDGYTVLNYIDPDDLKGAKLPGNAISLPVKDPRIAAETALNSLKTSGYQGTLHEISDEAIPPNCLVVVESDAFQDWVLVLRRHVIKMPSIERRKSTKKRR